MPRRFSCTSRLASFAFLALSATFACSAKLDLGSDRTGGSGSTLPQNPHIVSQSLADAGAVTGRPVRIVDREQVPCNSGDVLSNLHGFLVEAGRLYWLSLSPPKDTYSNYSAYSVYGCNIDDCASTLESSSSLDLIFPGCGPAMDDVWFGMEKDGDQLYWNDFDDMNKVPVHRVNTAASANVTGVTITQTWTTFQVDKGVLYFTSQDFNSLMKCNPSDCANTVETFALTPPNGSPAFNNGELLAQDTDYLYLSDYAVGSGARILRVRKIVGAPFEVIADNTSIAIRALKVDGDSVYWLENVFGSNDPTNARVFSCPKTGCVGSPKVLMTGLNRPLDLLPDGLSLYVLETPATNVVWNDPPASNEPEFNVNLTQPGRVLKCPISGCSDPDVVYESLDAVELSNIAVDDRYVYVRGQYCANSDVWHNPCGFIDVTPK